MMHDDWREERHGNTVLVRMQARSDAHVDQVAQQQRRPEELSMVVHVWRNVLRQQNEVDRTPPRRRDYVVPMGSGVTVLHGTCTIEKPDGSLLKLENVSRVEVATSV